MTVSFLSLIIPKTRLYGTSNEHQAACFVINVKKATTSSITIMPFI